MSEALSLLIVEDSEDDAELVRRKLSEGGFEPEALRVQTAEDMRAALDSRDFDLVISDYSMPGFDGTSAFSLLRESGKDIPFIFVSGTLGEENAVEAMRRGVSDYFVKGNLKRLAPAVRRELGKMEDRRRYRRAEASLKEAETQLSRSRRLESMGRMAAGLAHDFNNLLTVILGHTSLLLRDMEPSHEFWKQLNEVRDSSERASSLTRELLEFGAGRSARKSWVDLNTVILDAVPLLKRLVGAKVTLDLQVQPAPIWVHADPDHLGRVLTNLAVNARDAMSGQGLLTIRTSVRYLAEADLAATPQLRPGPHALLEVRDNGRGMEPETLAHVFEPFFTTKQEGKGTGLGLAIVFRAVQINEGDIRVESAPGQGALFSLLFPEVPGPGQQGNADLAGSSELMWPRETPRGLETILVAEDEETLRDYMSLALARRGFHVMTAGDAQGAMALARLHPGTIHLLITDLRLGRGDGRELARQLIADHRAATRVLFMTGYADPDTLDELDRGGVELLLKPFDVERLVKAIRGVLDRQASPEPEAREAKGRD